MKSFHPKAILKLMGFLLMIEGLFMFGCIPYSIYYGSVDLQPILLSAIITLVSGFLLRLIFHKANNRELGTRDAYIIVSFTWILISAYGTLPFMFSNVIPDFTDAFFESISGFSTTGASILRDIEIVPKGVLFWRSLTHWIGGMGIVVLAIAILPYMGLGGMQLFNAEAPGPSVDKLHPRMAETAKRLWGIYVLLTVAQVVLMLLGGMGLFDSLCHAFGTVATGGFGTKNTSYMKYSPYLQYITTIFMFFAGTSFTLHYLALKGKLRKVFKSEEYRAYIGLTLIATIIVAFLLWLIQNFSIEAAFRHALFQVVSIITCTGFASYDYMIWPAFCWFLIFVLMFAGGMVGSTSGGIKIFRHVLLFKNGRAEFRKMIHPNAVFPVRLDGRNVSPEIIHNVLAIFMIYITTFAIGTLILIGFGLALPDSMGSVATCMGGIGPGLGTTGPAGNFAHLHDVSKWTLSFLMLAGRLELITIYILFIPAFWRN